MDAELEKNKGLEESVLSMVNEISSVKSNMYDLEEEKKKITIDHQEEVGPVIQSTKSTSTSHLKSFYKRTVYEIWRWTSRKLALDRNKIGTGLNWLIRTPPS